MRWLRWRPFLLGLVYCTIRHAICISNKTHLVEMLVIALCFLNLSLKCEMRERRGDSLEARCGAVLPFHSRGSHGNVPERKGAAGELFFSLGLHWDVVGTWAVTPSTLVAPSILRALYRKSYAGHFVCSLCWCHSSFRTLLEIALTLIDLMGEKKRKM